jgi:hypothetical protein
MDQAKSLSTLRLKHQQSALKKKIFPRSVSNFNISASRFRMFQLLIVTLADKYQPSDSLLESIAMFEQSRVPPGIIHNLMFYI